MTASENVRPTHSSPVEVSRPEPAAGLVSTGILLLIGGYILVVAGNWNGLSVFGMMVFAGGALSLTFGIHRAVRNLDSIAAVAYNRSLSQRV